MTHPETATSLNNLALLYRAQGKYEQAEPLYMRALSICEQQLGAEHPHTQIILGNYLSLPRRMGQDEEVTRLERKHTPSS